jgi:hypothetical protein
MKRLCHIFWQMRRQTVPINAGEFDRIRQLACVVVALADGLFVFDETKRVVEVDYLA